MSEAIQTKSAWYVVRTQLRDGFPYTESDASLSRAERSSLVLVEEEIALFASAFLRRGLG